MSACICAALGCNSEQALLVAGGSHLTPEDGGAIFRLPETFSAKIGELLITTTRCYRPINPGAPCTLFTPYTPHPEPEAQEPRPCVLRHVELRASPRALASKLPVLAPTPSSSAHPYLLLLEAKHGESVEISEPAASGEGGGGGWVAGSGCDQNAVLPASRGATPRPRLARSVFQRLPMPRSCLALTAQHKQLMMQQRWKGAA